jgi:hypothetical protein
MKQIWNTETKVADLINEGQSIPFGWTEQSPKWVEFEAWDDENNCWGISFDLMKEKKKNDITKAFDDELSNGFYYSEILGINVDYRRGANKNDLQNVQSLISSMERNNISKTKYRGYDEHKEVTVNDLKLLAAEMEDHGLALYQKKWTIRSNIDKVKTKEELDNIQW